MTVRYVVKRTLRRGFTDPTPLYVIVDTETNLPEDDEFTNKRLAGKWAAHLNRLDRDEKGATA